MDLTYSPVVGHQSSCLYEPPRGIVLFPKVGNLPAAASENTSYGCFSFKATLTESLVSAILMPYTRIYHAKMRQIRVELTGKQ